MLLDKAYVIDGVKLQETIMYDIKMMLYHHATYENARSRLDKEGAFRWYTKYEMALRSWIFTLDSLDGRTPDQALYILYAQGYQEHILDAECTDDTLDIIFALDVCPNAEQEG